MTQDEKAGSGFIARLTINSWLALGLIVLGIGIWLLIPYQVDEPPTFFGRSSAGISPALFPQIAAIGFVLIGIVYFLSSAKMTVVNGFKNLPPSAYVNLGVVLAVMIVYVLLLRPLGYAISSSLAALTIALYYGSRNIIAIALVGIVAPLAIYFLFTRYLAVSLPPFPWSSL